MVKALSASRWHATETHTHTLRFPQLVPFERDRIVSIQEVGCSLPCLYWLRKTFILECISNFGATYLQYPRVSRPVPPNSTMLSIWLQNGFFVRIKQFNFYSELAHLFCSSLLKLLSDLGRKQKKCWFLGFFFKCQKRLNGAIILASFPPVARKCHYVHRQMLLRRAWCNANFIKQRFESGPKKKEMKGCS